MTATLWDTDHYAYTDPWEGIKRFRSLGSARRSRERFMIRRRMGVEIMRVWYAPDGWRTDRIREDAR